MTAPERIYLQGAADAPNCEDPNSGVTWCWHQIDDTDVEYVRADIAARTTAEQSRDSADAARYRWLRDSSDVPNGWAPMVFNCEAGSRLSWGNGLVGEELDAVMDPLIDAAIESQRSGDGS